MLATMVVLQLEMFILMAAGFVCSRLGIITPAGEKSLSSDLIMLVLPANILHGFINAGTPDAAFLENCILAFVLSFAIQLAAIEGSKLFFRHMPKEHSRVASYGMIVSNSSFVGLPVAEAIYSNIGVTYTSVFQIPIRFTMWSAGLALFCDVDRKETIRKVLTHPCIIACFIGVLYMLFPVPLPAPVTASIDSLSKCTTPLSMLAIGSILSGAAVDEVFTKDTAWFCALRLVIFPLLVWLVLMPWVSDATVRGVAVLMSAMPAGSTTAILPEQYGQDGRYGQGSSLHRPCSRLSRFRSSRHCCDVPHPSRSSCALDRVRRQWMLSLSG